MDKASIIKDAIDYIQLLQEQERRMRTEISELETFMAKERVVLPSCDEDAAEVLNFERRKKKLKAKSSLLVQSPLEVTKVTKSLSLHVIHVYVCFIRVSMELKSRHDICVLSLIHI